MELVIVMGFVLPFFLLCHNGVGAERSFSLEEDLELDKELRRLNKPAAKSIRSEHGDVYDCVDFYKQPAFDHPLLRNHSFHFQMKPSSYPKGRIEKSTGKPKNAARKGLSCPSGTVPIRRTMKADLLRARAHGREYFSKASDPNTVDRPGVHIAVARTSFNAKKKYDGGGMNISIEGPPAKAKQYTMGQMKILNGPDFVQVGWMVNPTLYGDYRTRFFIYIKTASQACFNILCPGFVLVRSDHPVDELAGPTSRPPGEIHFHPLMVYRDEKSGNWWFQRGENDDDVIGFWPQRLFTGLRDQAVYVDWGGEASSPLDVLSPPMGRGRFPRGRVTEDASCAQITVVNEDHIIVKPTDTEIYTDKRDYYRAKDVGDSVAFGGPGGATGYY